MTSLSALIVDDDPFMLEVTREMLVGAGLHDVRTADNGVSALAALAEGTTELIVCDLDMGTMDGLELLRHLAEAHYRGAIILQSGAGDDILATASDLARLHGHRLLAAASKPLSQDVLREAIAAIRSGYTQPARLEPVRLPAGRLTPVELKQGLTANRIELWAQPKVTVRDRRVVGAEALMRWRHADGSLISPDSVLPVAQDLGLEDDVTLTVLRLASRALALWRSRGHDLRISVNLSPGNLTSLSLPDALEATAHEERIDPQLLTLELPQVDTSSDLSMGLEVIGRLRLKGFGISIDDYGTGFSTLQGLKSLPVTELKVDQAFVAGAAGNQILEEILGSSTSLGQSLGLSVVAQGVEDATVLTMLEGLGCDEVQGYLVARPMPVEDFLAWKDRWDSTWGSGQRWPR